VVVQHLEEEVAPDQLGEPAVSPRGPAIAREARQAANGDRAEAVVRRQTRGGVERREVARLRIGIDAREEGLEGFPRAPLSRL
jgi:hypothetical protein